MKGDSLQVVGVHLMNGILDFLLEDAPSGFPLNNLNLSELDIQALVFVSKEGPPWIHPSDILLHKFPCYFFVHVVQHCGSTACFTLPPIHQSPGVVAQLMVRSNVKCLLLSLGKILFHIIGSDLLAAQFWRSVSV